MKKRIIIETEEKNRILNLHKKFLSEGAQDEFPVFGAEDTADSGETVQPEKPEDNSSNESPKKESSSGGYTDKYVREAQTLLGVKSDGKFGPITLQALKDKIGAGSSSTTTTGDAGSTTTTTTVNMSVVYGTSFADGSKPESKSTAGSETSSSGTSEVGVDEV